MMLTLAQVTSTEIGGWLMAAFAIVGGANQMLRLTDRLKDKPAPGEISEYVSKTYVTKEACGERGHLVDVRLDALETAMTEMRETFRLDMKEIRDAMNGLHRRLDPLVELVNYLRGRTDPGTK